MSDDAIQPWVQKGLVRCIPLVAVVCLAAAWTANGRQPARGGTRNPGLYDPDPNHIWNRVHRQLHVRVAADGSAFGADEVDPLLWRETAFLLVPPSHAAACKLLDEFLNSGAEKLVKDPLERAVFQHDLWAVFDWVAARPDDNPEARHALALRLARIIRRVALTEQEIERLPDNYASAVTSRSFPERYDPRDPVRAFLPPDLLDARGPWVNITDSFTDPVATQHALAFSHSEFLVLLNVPGDAAATSSYLKRLWEFPEPFVTDPIALDGERRTQLNLDLPQLPSGTRVALVRRMLLVDRTGRIRRTHLTESLQLRVFKDPSRAGLPNGMGFYGDQDFFEFRMSRRDMFARHSGGLRAVAPDERGFITFSAQGIDSFEQPSPLRGPGLPILSGCVNCHAERGVRSLRIAPRLLKPHALLDYRHPRWSTWATPAPEAKVRRFDWGLLTGLWQSSPW